jgi:uncharacterized protein
MVPIDARIIRFFHKHHVFTLATCNNNEPYTCSCFYVYLEEQNCIAFTSGNETRHAKELAIQPRVAGAIALETRIVGKVQGIQFTGDCYLLQGDALRLAKAAYHKHFPVSLLMDLTLWGIRPDFIKMTHNALGFGNKLIWENRGNLYKNTY